MCNMSGGTVCAVAGDREGCRSRCVVSKGLSPKMTIEQRPEGSGSMFQTVGTGRAKTPKAAAHLACLIKNKETSVNTAEREEKFQS